MRGAPLLFRGVFRCLAKFCGAPRPWEKRWPASNCGAPKQRHANNFAADKTAGRDEAAVVKSDGKCGARPYFSEAFFGGLAEIHGTQKIGARIKKCGAIWDLAVMSDPPFLRGEHIRVAKV